MPEFGISPRQVPLTGTLCPTDLIQQFLTASRHPVTFLDQLLTELDTGNNLIKLVVPPATRPTVSRPNLRERRPLPRLQLASRQQNVSTRPRIATTQHAVYSRLVDAQIGHRLPIGTVERLQTAAALHRPPSLGRRHNRLMPQQALQLGPLSQRPLPHGGPLQRCRRPERNHRQSPFQHRSASDLKRTSPACRPRNRRNQRLQLPNHRGVT